MDLASKAGGQWIGKASITQCCTCAMYLPWPRSGRCRGESGEGGSWGGVTVPTALDVAVLIAAVLVAAVFAAALLMEAVSVLAVSVAAEPLDPAQGRRSEWRGRAGSPDPGPGGRRVSGTVS